MPGRNAKSSGNRQGTPGLHGPRKPSQPPNLKKGGKTGKAPERATAPQLSRSGLPSEKAIKEVTEHLYTTAGALRWAIEESGGHIVEPCKLCGEEHWEMGAKKTACPNSAPARR